MASVHETILGGRVMSSPTTISILLAITATGLLGRVLFGASG